MTTTVEAVAPILEVDCDRTPRQARYIAKTIINTHIAALAAEGKVIVDVEPTEVMVEAIAREWCQITDDYPTCLDCHHASGDEQRCGSFDNAKAGLEKMLSAREV